MVNPFLSPFVQYLQKLRVPFAGTHIRLEVDRQLGAQEGELQDLLQGIALAFFWACDVPKPGFMWNNLRWMDGTNRRMG